jgi:hypothetical protein
MSFTLKKPNDGVLAVIFNYGKNYMRLPENQTNTVDSYAKKS